MSKEGRRFAEALCGLLTAAAYDDNEAAEELLKDFTPTQRVRITLALAQVLVRFIHEAFDYKPTDIARDMGLRIAQGEHGE